MKKIFFIGMFLAVLGFSTIANATLVNNGGGLIYDSDLNITWYDVTYSVTQPYNDTTQYYDRNYWAPAVDWAAGLNAGGVTGWRLPTAVDSYNGTTASQYNNTVSEMGHLFYTELGNMGAYAVGGTAERPEFYDINGEIIVQNKGPFTNLQLGDLWTWAVYWSGTESADPHGVFAFNTTYGYQDAQSKSNPDIFAMAVHEGNIGAQVPEPATMLLFGLGLLGLSGIRRKLKK